MSITAGGIGSGLDVESLVRQLVAAEGASKKSLLSRQESTLQAELSAFGRLKSALTDFQSALADLKDASAFQVRSATSSSEDAFTTSATSAAASGTYDIQVNSIAVQHKLAAATTYADTDTTTIGAAGDTMTIDVGSGTGSFTVDIGGKTLAEIRDAINDAADNAGVSATIVNDGTGNRLMLTADETGSDGYMAVTYSGADPFALDDSYQAGIRGNADGTLTAAELDASFTIDGLAVTSSSNSVSGVIEGVTLDLKGTTTGTETLSVALDKASAKESVEALVESYNKLVDVMNSVSAYNGGTNPAALFGDGAVRSMDFRLHRELTSVVSTTSGAFSTLAEIGITTDSDGKLSIDSTELEEAMTTDFDGIGELFAGTDGYAVNLDTAVSEFLDTDGLLDSRTDGINARLEDIGEQRERLEDRLLSLEERYRREFTALDVAMAQMQTTSSYLAQQLAALG